MIRIWWIVAALVCASPAAVADQLSIPYLWSSLFTFQAASATGAEAEFEFSTESPSLPVGGLIETIENEMFAGQELNIVQLLHSGPSESDEPDSTFGQILQDTIRGLAVFDRRNRQ